MNKEKENIYIISKEESERLNILKYIAIIFVVYIHSNVEKANFAEGTQSLHLPRWLDLFENLISQNIARCAVPLFFLISAMLLFKKQREYKKTIKDKIRTLLLPYLIWNSVWIFIYIILQNLSFTAAFFSGQHIPIIQRTFFEWLELYGIGLDLPEPQVYPLWFMRDLMLVTLGFPIIEKIANKFPRQLMVGTLTLLVMPINFPLKQALLWFCLGASIVKLKIRITILDDISMTIMFLVYVLCTFIALVTKSSIINVLFIYVGILFWIRVSKTIFNCQKARSLFLRLSRWTFIIYVAHEMTLCSLFKICLRFLPTEPMWLFLEYIFLPIAVIVGCSIVGMILEKTTPKLYSILTGAR